MEVEILITEGKNLRKLEYFKILSQLHFSMWLQGTRYGYILTNLELVCVHRPGNEYGEIEEAAPIQLGDHDYQQNWGVGSG